MKKTGNILWGIALILVGSIFALNAFGITDIEIFFDGWWTLFIIVPCGIGLINEQEKTGNLIGLGIGVFLLLCCQDVLDFDMLWKLAVPAIIVIIGLKLIFSAIFGEKANNMLVEIRQNGGNVKDGCAVFSGQDLNYAGEVFNGGELTAVFGGIKCDLRNAIIEKDCAINTTAVFGGVDIYVPDGVNVKINSTSIFGGVSHKNHHANFPGAVTLYINATCMFGGVEIK